MPRLVKLSGQALAVGLVIGLFSLLVWKVAQQEAGVSRQLASGKRPEAPGFSLPRLDRAGKLSLAALKGNVLVLNFWYSTCPPCKREAPVLQAAWEQYRAQRVVVVGVDFWDFKSRARAFMRRHGITYPNVHDGSGSMLAPYGVIAAPETFVVGRDGRILVHIRGELSSEQLRDSIELALAA